TRTRDSRPRARSWLDTTAARTRAPSAGRPPQPHRDPVPQAGRKEPAHGRVGPRPRGRPEVVRRFPTLQRETRALGGRPQLSERVLVEVARVVARLPDWLDRVAPHDHAQPL